MSILFETMLGVPVFAVSCLRGHRHDSGPHRGWDVVHSGGGRRRLPHNGQTAPEVRGQVQARHPGTDLAKAAARQYDQAAPGRTPDLNQTHYFFYCDCDRCQKYHKDVKQYWKDFLGVGGVTLVVLLGMLGDWETSSIVQVVGDPAWAHGSNL